VAVVAPVLKPPSLVLVALLSLSTLAGVAFVGAWSSDPLAAAFVTSALLLLGSSLGAAVGGRVAHAGHLLVVVVVSVLVDTFSVFHSFGPTAAVIERPQVIALIALPWPVLGESEISPVLGVADGVFAALYLSAARRHGLGVMRIAIAVACGLVATAVTVVATQRSIPALVGMGLAVLAACPRARRLPAEDRRLGWAIIIGLSVLWLGLWVVR
jgi:hypothetical protein